MVVRGVLESLFGLLLPHLSGVRVDEVDASSRTIRLEVHSEAVSAACPDCGNVSDRVHSRYMRQLTDLSIGGRGVCIRLQARRFRCLSLDCPRKIFAEQITCLAGRYRRRSSLLTELLTKVALALGGRAGQRMTGHLAADVSRSTLLRLIRALPLPATGIAAIGRTLHLTRTTVRRYARAATAEHLLTEPGKRTSILDEHIPYLLQRWDDGCTNATHLHAELRERGYKGSARAVRRLVQDWRTAPPPPADVPPPVPTPRQVTGWMMKPAADLTDDEKQHLRQILHRSDTLTKVNQLVSDFAGMVRERRGRHLDTWIADAKDSGITHLSSFANGLLNDHDAVRNGLTLEWSSGAVEGNVNRIKMIKRTMYGRANFDLLRARVLLAD